MIDYTKIWIIQLEDPVFYASHLVDSISEHRLSAIPITNLVSRVFGHPPSLSHEYNPPFIDSTCPVMYPASEEAKKPTACATSSAVPNLFTGIMDCNSFSSSPSVISVFIK